MYIHIFYMGNLRILPRVRLSQANPECRPLP